MLSLLRSLTVLICFGLLPPGVAFAETLKSDLGAVKQAMWLKGRGRLEEAAELLARSVELNPESELLITARADLYLAQDNPFWALKVLNEYALAHPPACEAKTFAARVQIQQANLELADELLKEPGCDAPEALKVRRLLLRAELAELRGKSEDARRLVSEAESHSSRFEEDDARLTALEQAYEPYRLPLWTFALDAATGYVSTGMGQAPLEVSTSVPRQGSAMANLHLLGRVVLPYRPRFRPVAEIEFNLTEQLSERTRELSVRQPVLRLGALLGREQPRLQLNYAYELVDFDGTSASKWSGDWFSFAHRGEYRLELDNGLFSFGKVGYRQFYDHRLSRVESETGVLKNWGLSETLGVSLGGTVRGYKADFAVFDQVGLSGFLGVNVQAPKGFTLQEALTVSHDRFPASQRFYAPEAPDRRDWRLNATATVLSPEVAAIRFALAYSYVSRDSNTALYDYEDHRVLFELHYRVSHDQWRAKRISAEGRVPLHHEKETPKVIEAEGRSVKDALRQDDELRRGTSCLK